MMVEETPLSYGGNIVQTSFPGVILSVAAKMEIGQDPNITMRVDRLNVKMEDYLNTNLQ